MRFLNYYVISSTTIAKILCILTQQEKRYQEIGLVVAVTEPYQIAKGQLIKRKRIWIDINEIVKTEIKMFSVSAFYFYLYILLKSTQYKIKEPLQVEDYLSRCVI